MAYPVEVLRAWTTLAEHRAGMELHRLPVAPLDGPERVGQEFEARRSTFHDELKSGRFGSLEKLLGTLGLIMMPLVPSGDIDFAKFRTELENGLKPIGNGSSVCRSFGDYYECRESKENNRFGSCC